MEISFEGKRAVVTGATKGIGREIALKLAKCGAQVIAIGRDTSELDSLKQAALPAPIHTIPLDLTHWQTTQSTLSTLPPVDLLVNNAGLAILKPLPDNTEPDIDAIFNINVKSLIHVTQIIAADLIKRKARSGSIVNISSQASLAGLHNHSVYCASKGAVDAYTRAAALELGRHNIRVNSVNPTVIMTDMGRLGWSNPGVAGAMLEKIPLRRFGEVGEVVDAVLFLLSDKASMISGSCLAVDGGFLAC